MRDLDVYKVNTIFAGSQGNSPREIVEPMGSVAGESKYGSLAFAHNMAESKFQPHAGNSLSRTSYT